MLLGHLRQLTLREPAGSFIWTQGGVFDFCRGGQRLWILEITRGGM